MTVDPRTRLIAAAIVLLPFAVAVADESKELRKQRDAAYKDRQALVREQEKKSEEAVKAFQALAKELNLETKEELRRLETEFDLREVDLEAAHEARVAEAEAEYRKKWGEIATQRRSEGAALEKIREEHEAYSRELFALRKRSAGELHAARVANEREMHAVETERDRKLLDEAEKLGLTKSSEPYLAAPIGSELTEKGQKWNEREAKRVEKLESKNRKLLLKYTTGEDLRLWEIENLEEDFRLEWEKKAEHHEVEAEQIFFGFFMLEPGDDPEKQQKEMIERAAELDKEKKLIDIRYQKIGKANGIRRREEKEKLREGVPLETIRKNREGGEE